MADSPTAGLSAASAAAFEKLRLRFAAGLQQRWADISEASNAEQQITALHQLAGAAGSYGWEPLGAAARRAELALQQAQPEALATALQELRALIEAAMTET
ncbi:Hpt domain-containing protein [Paucibacter sp. AS339]|uniref:Hpt domain-containing protein n=1 Tax=Paucibacter hankyongi TaxID=3133434 RepID=UPI0030A00B01